LSESRASTRSRAARVGVSSQYQPFGFVSDAMKPVGRASSRVLETYLRGSSAATAIVTTSTEPKTAAPTTG
jgi:hypothetical protein